MCLFYLLSHIYRDLMWLPINLDQNISQIIAQYLPIDDSIVLDNLERIEYFYLNEYVDTLYDYGFSTQLFRIAINNGKLLIADFIYERRKVEVGDCFYDLVFDYKKLVAKEYIDSLLYILHHANNKQVYLEFVFKEALMQKNDNVLQWVTDACKYCQIEYLTLVKSLIKPNTWNTNFNCIYHVCKTANKHDEVIFNCVQMLLDISLVHTRLLVNSILNIDTGIFGMVLYDAIKGMSHGSETSKNNSFRTCRWLYENCKYYQFVRHRCSNRINDAIWVRVRGILSGKKSYYRDTNQNQVGFPYMF